MVKIIEISNNHNQSIRIEGNVLTYRKVERRGLLYSTLIW